MELSRNQPNLLLIGLRGSGKSTVGRLTARRLGREFVDLDDLTPREMGYPSVAQAWAAGGEGAFREAETVALRKLLRGAGQVIALGGGTPTNRESRGLIEEAQSGGGALVVYLRAPADVLRSRLEGADNADRPTLTGAGTLEEIEAIFDQRDPTYRALADWVVEVGAMTLEQAADSLAAHAG